MCRRRSRPLSRPPPPIATCKSRFCRMPAPLFEPIFIAANVREADFVENVLEDEGVEYTQRLEPFMRETSGVCYQGVLFEVMAGQADYCRHVLTEKGLARGIVSTS